MSLNQVPLPSQTRTPRALITVNGTVIRELESIEYIENNYYQPDSFRIRMPLYSLQESGINIEYWQSQAAILVEIFIGFPSNPLSYGTSDLQSMVLGAINDLSTVPFDNGQGYVEFDGFDLSKKFIDNKTTLKYPNQTSSEIVTTLAQNEGLTPIVTPTSTPVSYYYTQDYVQLGNSLTEWDLITFLAQKEGFQAFVRGQSFYFQPRPLTSPSPYQLTAQTLENGNLSTFNGSMLRISRNMNYAKDVIVTINSWNAYSGHVTATAKATKNKPGVLAATDETIGQPQTYTYTIPGLTKEQALQRAQTILQDISLHERTIEAMVPGTNDIRKDGVIQLTGISLSCDQTYYPDTISRRISPAEGYIMNIIAKNHSPDSVVAI